MLHRNSKLYVPHLLHQLTRFGALSFPQMMQVLEDSARMSTLYKHLRPLTLSGILRRSTHPQKPVVAFVPTRALYRCVYGRDELQGKEIPREGRPTDLVHTLLCAEVMLRLARLSNVKGLATEYEYRPEDLATFCLGRRPDGVICIEQGGLQYEVAVEVEASQKAKSRILQMLEDYALTFSRPEYGCKAVIVFAGQESIRRAYEEAWGKLSSFAQERVAIISKPDLSELDPKIYGVITESARPCLEKLRKRSGQGVEYRPLVFADWEKLAVILHPKNPHVGRVSQAYEVEADLVGDAVHA